MDNFLKGSGAVIIGLAFALAFTLPYLAIGIVLGWFFIQQELGED